MTVDDLKIYYKVKSDADLAKIIGRTRGCISKWRSRGIAIETQAIFQLKTDGKVKANPQLLIA